LRIDIAVPDFIARPPANPFSTSDTARPEQAALVKAQAGTERVDQLVSALLSAAADVVRRHAVTRAECEAFKVWLTQVGAEAQWLSVVDALAGNVINGGTNCANQEESTGGSASATAARIVRAAMSIAGREYNTADRVLATVLFTDIVDSTGHAAKLGDSNWLNLLERHDALTRLHITRFQGRVVRHTGDGVVAIFDRPSSAVHSAAAMTQRIPKLGIRIRCGLHTGECELRGDDIGGIAVHTGARIAAVAAAGEVLVSRTVRDLVNGSGIAFENRGTHVLRGIPGRWNLFACS
jgi:class 3 adenylate cyclase